MKPVFRPPAFNVSHFSGNVTVNMNRTMLNLMLNFMMDQEGDLEPHFFALRSELDKVKKELDNAAISRRTRVND